MQIPAVRTEALAFTLIASHLGSMVAHAEMTPFGERVPAEGSSTSVAASQPASGAPAPASAPAPAAPSAPAGGGSGSDAATGLDYMYNRKPQDGSAAKQAADANRQAQGKAIAADAVGKSDEGPELKARFDRYLGMQEVSKADLTGYQAQLQKVKDLLTANQVMAAWKELRNLSQYQRIDSGISQELANRIESVWSTDKNSFRFIRRKCV